MFLVMIGLMFFIYEEFKDFNHFFVLDLSQPFKCQACKFEYLVFHFVFFDLSWIIMPATVKFNKKFRYEVPRVYNAQIKCGVVKEFGRFAAQ